LEAHSQHFSDNEIIKIARILTSKFVNNFITCQNETPNLVKSLCSIINNDRWYVANSTETENIIKHYEQKIKELSSLHDFLIEQELSNDSILPTLMSLMPLSSDFAQRFFKDFQKNFCLIQKKAEKKTIMEVNEDLFEEQAYFECDFLVEIGTIVIRDLFNDANVSHRTTSKGKKNHSSMKNTDKLIKQKQRKEKKRYLPAKTRSIF
jgi:hypothetical protein